MNNIIKFYTDILKTFNIVEENNKLMYISSTGKKLPINIEGLPIILPKKELIADIVEIVDGKPRLKARIFNPLSESVIKGENKSLTKLRRHIERMVEYSFIGVSMILLQGVKYQEELENYDPKFLEFIDMLKYNQPGVKKVVDDETIKKWETLADIGTDKDKTFLHMFVKKGGKIGDTKYTRVGTITFPLYEELENMNVKEDLLLGKVKLRNKDKHVFQRLYEFIFELTKDELLDGYMVGTKNTTSPSFIVTMMMYDFLRNKINKAIDVAKSLNLDNELLDTLILPDIPLPIEELEKFVDKIKYELLEIPTDHDLLIMDYNPNTADNTTQQQTQQTNPQHNTQQPKSVFETNQQPITQPQQEDSDELSPEEAMRIFGVRGGAPYGGFPSSVDNRQPAGGQYPPASYGPPSTGNPLIDGLMAAEQKAYMERVQNRAPVNPTPGYGYGNPNAGMNSGGYLPPRNNTYPRGYQQPYDPYGLPRGGYDRGYNQPDPRQPYDQPPYNPYDPYGLYGRR